MTSLNINKTTKVTTTKVTTASPQRFSIMMRNLDFNAYRGFKLTGEKRNSENSTNNIKKYNYDINKLKQQKFTFDTREGRYRWQESKNLGEKWELTGNIVKKSDIDSQPANWEGLMSKTSSLPPRKDLYTKYIINNIYNIYNI